MRQYWFGDISDEDCIPADGDDEYFVARIRFLQENTGSFVPMSDDDIQRCSSFRTRAEYISRLRRISISLAKIVVQELYQTRDQELIHLVRMIDELDQATSHLSDNLAEWHEIRTISSYTRHDRQSVRQVITDLTTCDDTVISAIAREMVHLYETRSLLASQVKEIADEIMPNTSALLGPLVASRIMSAAGGLFKLAALPGSTVQVLGAKSALFSHITTGSPPPKHGIVYQHSRVHRAPMKRRGRVARVIAAKVVIAARIDFYRKEKDPSFLEDADAQIHKAGTK